MMKSWPGAASRADGIKTQTASAQEEGIMISYEENS